MSRASGNKSTTKNGSPMLAGILVGMVVGVALAAGMAWFILKSPSPFVNKNIDVKPSVEIARQLVEPAVKAKASAASGVEASSKVETSGASEVAEAKPRFEFYKVLTDKTDATVDAPSKPTDAASPKSTDATAPKPIDARPADKIPESKPAIKYLQAGAFSDADDAEELKATLAMKGLEASIQTITLPGKGEIHRVRVGPFHSKQEFTSARGALKSSGLEAIPVR